MTLFSKDKQPSLRREEDSGKSTDVEFKQHPTHFFSLSRGN